MPTKIFQYAHECETFEQAEAQTILYHQKQGKWIMPLYVSAQESSTPLWVRWCPFCGEKLKAPVGTERERVGTGFVAIATEEVEIGESNEGVPVQECTRVQ